MATRAEARAALLVHYSPTRRPELESLCAAAGPWIRPAVPGLTAIVAAGRAGRDLGAGGSGDRQDRLTGVLGRPHAHPRGDGPGDGGQRLRRRTGLALGHRRARRHRHPGAR